ncbi:amidohydrolase family protein [Henriciella sp. AS95]|uniref:amidohydrolase family protein n=1 Tax=Henriciella sp. AS95 TaxID=3135782 RepID=UPI00317E175B
MSKITRKDFLGLSSAMVVSAGLSACVGTQATASASAPATAKAPPNKGKVLIKNADVLTMNTARDELTGTDVLVENGKIVSIGKGLSAPDAEIIDASGMILMPGMIDGHRHVWECIEAGRLVKFHPAEYSTYQQWKMRTIVSMNADEMYLSGLVGGLLAIDSGVTSMLDYAHGQINQENAIASAKGLQDSGIAGWFGFQLGVSSSYKPGDTVDLTRAHSERIARTTETHWATADALKRDVFNDPDALLQMGLCPASGMGDELSLIKDEWTRARSYDLGILGAHIHKPETPFPPGHMGHRGSGMLDLADAGMLGPDYHISHANRLTEDEFRVLRESGGMVCATAMGEFPYMTAAYRGPSCHGRARAAGVATGIGIDVSLALTHDYFEHVRAGFWNLYLSPEGVALANDYKAHDALDFATNLGAKAVRLENVAGSIETGKRADLVLLKTDRPGFGRLGTLADRVVTFAAREDIDSVWIAGQARKRGGEMVDVDLKDLMQKVYAAQDRYGPLAESITFV